MTFTERWYEIMPDICSEKRMRDRHLVLDIYNKLSTEFKLFRSGSQPRSLQELIDRIQDFEVLKNKYNFALAKSTATNKETTLSTSKTSFFKKFGKKKFVKKTVNAVEVEGEPKSEEESSAEGSEDQAEVPAPVAATVKVEASVNQVETLKKKTTPKAIEKKGKDEPNVNNLSPPPPPHLNGIEWMGFELM